MSQYSKINSKTVPRKQDQHTLPQISTFDGNNYEDQRRFSKVSTKKKIQINLPELAAKQTIMDSQSSMNELRPNQKLMSALKDNSIRIKEGSYRDGQPFSQMNSQPPKIFSETKLFQNQFKEERIG